MTTTRMKLLISNVAVDCQDSDLKAWIETRGYEVVELRMIRDAVSGTSPSFAQVELANPAGLDDAVHALNGRILMGRTIHVRPVVPRRAAAAAGGYRPA